MLVFFTEHEVIGNDFELRNGSFVIIIKDYIFKDISFTIKSGEILTILGRNGIGKTTLVKCISVQQLQEGNIYINNKLVSPHDNAPIGYVPQARELSFPYSRRNVLMGRSRHIGMFSVPTDKDYEIVHSVLKRIGISSLFLKQHQAKWRSVAIAFIARALASEPQLLIMDEPESHLDFKNQYTMLSLIRNIVDDLILLAL
ncbi:MAG: ABC transporter ATP-binding protein [Veillonella sp.]